MAHKDGSKSGGRTKGTPNKATGELKGFLDRVFKRAFTETTRVTTAGPDGETLVADVSLEDLLVKQILTMAIEPALLRTLLAYWAGQPAKSIDHNHKGKVTLEEIVAGVAHDAAAESGDEADADEEA